MTVEVLVSGIDRFTGIMRAVERAVDPDEVAEDVGNLLLATARIRFRATVDPDGNKWPESQRARLRKAGVPTKGSDGRFHVGGDTLFESGTLFRSLNLRLLGSGQAALSTSVSYGRFHQTGTRFHPPRVFLGFGEEDEELARDKVVSRIVAAVRRAV